MSTRVLPDTSHPDFAAYWQGCTQRRLLMPQCANGHLIWPPRPTCTACGEPVQEWVDAPSTGRLYSWTVVHRTRLAWYSEQTPYVVGIVRLDHPQPVRLVARCEVEPAHLVEGLELVLDFEAAGRRMNLPYWRRPRAEA